MKLSSRNWRKAMGVCLNELKYVAGWRAPQLVPTCLLVQKQYFLGSLLFEPLDAIGAF